MARRDDAPPCPTIFVGNLSYDLTDQDVIDHFSQVGPVKHVRLVAERETGKPRGFGFVEFFDTPTAESAIRNLSGKDFKGRPVRIVYADGGPGDFRRDFDGPPRGAMGGPGMGGPGMGGRQPLRDRVVGGDLAYHASMGAAAALGAPAPPGAPADAITHLLARRSRAELYDYLAQMQGLLQRNPAQARQILADNPQLAKALFQMQVILGMVANPLGDVAPRGIAPPNLMPRPGQDQVPPPHMGGPPGPMGGLPGPMGGPPDMGPPPHGMMEGPPPHMGGPPPHMGMQGPPPMGGPPGPMGGPPGPMAPPMQPQQPPYMQGPPPMEQPGYGGAPPQGYMQPPPQQPYMQPPPQQQPYMQPPPAQQPVDPRRAAAGAPRPMVSMAQAPPPVAPMAPPATAAPAMGAGLTSEQQQALLQQVMSLTPEQIELLPPAQKAQVQALQQSLRGQ